MRLLKTKFFVVAALFIACLLMAPAMSLAATVTGTLHDGDTPVDQTWLSIKDKATGSEHYAWVSEGQFSVDLTGEGQYVADKYWDEEKNEYVFLNAAESTFTVADVVYGEPLALFKPVGGVGGTVSSIDGPVERGWLYIQSEEANPEYYYAKIADGAFSLYLPDGEYTAYAFWDEVGYRYIEVGRTFTVTGGTTATAVIVAEAPKNVSGTVTAAVYTGEPVQGWINFYEASDQTWFGAPIRDGEFAIDLEDGTYQVDGYWDEALQEYVKLFESFTVENGALADGPLELTEPAKNVNGSVSRDDEPFVHVWLSFRTVDYSQWYGVTTDESGEFSATIPDGEYVLDGFWSEEDYEYIHLGLEFSIQGGVVQNGVSLDIELPGKNVTGTLTDSAETPAPIGGVWLNFYNVEDPSSWYNVRTAENGTFALHLPDGEYQVDGFWNEATFEYEKLYDVFEVAGGELLGGALSLQLPEKNAVGSLTKENNDPIAGVWLNFRETTEDLWFSAQTDENGEFALYLADGTYEVQGFWDEATGKYVDKRVPFEIANGALTDADALNIVILDNNVNGTLAHAADGPVEDVWLNLYNIDTYEWYGVYVEEGGHFSTFLPDGEYAFSGYWDEENERYVELYQEFAIANGDLISGSVNILIPANNVVGSIVDASGEPVEGVWVNIHAADFSDYFHAITDEDGEFETYLPDGDYVLDGYWDDEDHKYESLSIAFTVAEGEVVDPAALHIVMPDQNVFGSLSDEDGEPIADAYLNIRKADYTKWFGEVTDEEGGFSLYLPDGEYVIDGFHMPVSEETGVSYGEYKWLNIEFTVEDGEVTEPDLLEIMLEKMNVNGVLLDKNEEPIAGVFLNIRNEDSGDWDGDYTNEAGKFSLALDDGDYVVEGFWDPYYGQTETGEYYGAYVKLGIAFSVVDGEVTEPNVLRIVLPGDNVTGSLTTEDGEPIAGVNVTIINQATYEEIDVETDEEGQFSLYLPDGNYLLAKYFYGEFVHLDVEFSIVDGIVTNPEDLHVIVEDDVEHPEPNVHGSLSYPDGAPVPHVEIEISDGSDIPLFVETDDAGQFAVYLEDGDYVVEGFYRTNYEEGEPYEEFVELGIAFTVAGGVLTEPEKLHMEVAEVVDPEHNVTGVLKDGEGDGIAHAVFEIYGVDADHYFEVDTDDTGEFGIELEDGQYIVKAVLVPSRVESDEHGHYYHYERTYLDIPFSVVDGTLSGAESLTLVVPADNANGVLSDVYGEPIAQAGVMIYEVENERSAYASTNEAGEFGIWLQDGKYYVVGIHVSNEYSDEFVELFVPFEIANGEVVNPSVLNIALREPEIDPEDNVSGIVEDVYGEPIAGAELLIYNTVHFDGYSVKTDEIGQFSLYLPDGAYEIELIFYSPVGTEIKVFYPAREFVVYDDALQGEEQLNVVIPKDNVSGVLQDVNGLPVADAGITIFGESEEIERFAVTDTAGRFSLWLQDGDYVIDGVFAYGNYIPITHEFSVVGGQIEGGGELLLELPAANAVGVLQDVYDEPIAHVQLQITNQTNYEVHFDDTNENGQFSLWLPDGEYYVEGYYDYAQNDFVEIGVDFTVANGAVTDPSKLILVADRLVYEPEHNVAGVLSDVYEDPIQGARIEISGETTGIDPYVFTDQDGRFSVSLPDGDYVVEAVFIPQIDEYKGTYMYLDIPFAVAGGVLVGAEALDIRLPASNVVGVLEDVYGLAVPHARIDIYDETNDRYADVWSGDAGDFSIWLADGEYSLEGVYVQNGETENGQPYEQYYWLNIPFTVSGGSVQDPVDLSVVVLQPDDSPNPNVYGVIYDVYGEFEALEIEIYDETNDRHVAAMANVDGYFSLWLEDGSYAIEGVSVFRDVDGELVEEFVDLHVPFTVADSVVTNPEVLWIELGGGTGHEPGGLVTGSIVDSFGQAIGGMEILISDNGFTFEAKAVTNESGEFSVSLPDGGYYIEGVWSPETAEFSYLYLPFAVLNGEAVDPSDLHITIEENNVFGRLDDGDGQGTSFTSIDIYSLTEGLHYYEIADDVGSFSLWLKDGEYVIQTYYDFYYSHYVPVDVAFSVVDGIVSKSLVIPVSGPGTGTPEPGVVTSVLEDVYGPVPYVELKIVDAWDYGYYTGTNAAGEFSIELPDGEYEIAGYYDDSTGNHVNFSIPFTVSGGVVIAPSDFTRVYVPEDAYVVEDAS